MNVARKNDELTGRIIGLAIEVHRLLGPGLLESTYEECLCLELKRSDVGIKRQLSLPVIYKGLKLDCGYRLDLVVDNRVIVEVKSIERLIPIHEAQLLTYMKLSNIRTGLLLNFNCVVLKDGIRRMMLPEINDKESVDR